jgi:serine/threonine protein kinase
VDKEFPPELLERFDFLGEIGSGGSGSVFKARDKTLKRLLAIKLLKSNRSDSMQYFARLQREAKTVCRLKHPAIIEVYDFILTSDEQPIMVMEYVEGKTLHQIVEENGPLNLIAAINIFMAICKAMQYAHDQGILHRDLTPSNIVLKGDYPVKGEPIIKILDFGIAKVEDGLEKTISKTGFFFGTPSVSSPEQARGEKTDERSDVYSLGCLMYKTLTGKFPLVGDNLLHSLQRQIFEEAPSLAEKNLEIEYPLKLEDIVAKALSKAPEDRFQSMQELDEALNNLLSDLQVDSKSEVKEAVVRTNGKRKFIILLALAAALPLCISLWIWNYREAHQGVVAIEERMESDWLIVREKVDDICFETLNENSNIKRIKLSEGTSFSKSNFARLLSYKPILLDLRGNQLDDKVFEIISECHSIRSLILTGCRGVTTKGVQHLVSIPRLEILPIDNTGITDSALKSIGKLKQLRLLYISKSNKITDKCIPSLLQLRKLQSLQIGDTRISPGKVRTLILELPELVSIEASGLGIHDNDIPENIRQSFGLMVLANNPVTDELFERIWRLKLYYLDVTHCPKVTEDACLKYLSAHKKNQPIVQYSDMSIENRDAEFYLDPAMFDRSNYDPRKMRALFVESQFDKFTDPQH